MNTSSLKANAGADPVLLSAISKVKRHILPLFVIMFIVNSIQGGLYGLAATSIIAAIIVFAARNTPKPKTATTPATPTASHV